jgi:hypothetical protein
MGRAGLNRRNTDILMNEMEKLKQMLLAEIEALVKVNAALEKRVKALENRFDWTGPDHRGQMWPSANAFPLQTFDEISS